MQLNVHQENYKKGDISGIEGEQKRLLKNYKDEVDLSRSNENTVINYISDNRWRKIIAERIKTHESISGKKIRKDANLFCSIVSSVPRTWGKDKITEYFEMQNKSTEELLKRYGLDDNSLLSSITHYDEPNSNPHNTLTYMPLHEGKFNRKAILKREFFSELQEVQWNNYLAFAKVNPNLEMMTSPEFKKGRKHLDETQYKAATLEKRNTALEIEVKNKQNESLAQDSFIKAKKQMVSELDSGISTKQNELREVVEKVKQGKILLEDIDTKVNIKKEYATQLEAYVDELKQEVNSAIDTYNELNNTPLTMSDSELSKIVDTDYKVSEKGNVFVPHNLWQKIVEMFRNFFNMDTHHDNINKTIKSINALETTYSNQVKQDSMNKGHTTNNHDEH